MVREVTEEPTLWPCLVPCPRCTSLGSSRNAVLSLFHACKIVFISAFFPFAVVLSQWYLSKGQTLCLWEVCVVVPARASVTAEPTSPLGEPAELCQFWNSISADLSLGGFLPGLVRSGARCQTVVEKPRVDWKWWWPEMVRWGSTATGYQHSSCCRHSACQWWFSLGCQDPAIAILQSSQAWESEHLSSTLFLACHMTSRKSPWFSCSFSPCF